MLCLVVQRRIQRFISGWRRSGRLLEIIENYVCNIHNVVKKLKKKFNVQIFFKQIQKKILIRFLKMPYCMIFEFLITCHKIIMLIYSTSHLRSCVSFVS